MREPSISEFPLPKGNEKIDPSVAGIELRDYFAAKAMQAITEKFVENSWAISGVAEEAYLFADAMMKAREA